MDSVELVKQEEILFEIDGSNFMEQVERLENMMINSGSKDVIIGDSEIMPLKHSFSEGIYVREIFIPKGMFVIGKIHKLCHTFFLMKGKLRILTQDGVKEIEAPFYGNADAGTKRVMIALEDTVFLNVHPNPQNIKEMDKLEEQFVVSSYKEFSDYKLLKK
jgi:hypothetical protein